MKKTATYGDLREVLRRGSEYGEKFSLFVTNTSGDDSFDNLELNLDLTTRIIDIGNDTLEFDIEFEQPEFDDKEEQIIRSIGLKHCAKSESHTNRVTFETNAIMMIVKVHPHRLYIEKIMFASSDKHTQSIPLKSSS